MNADTPQKILVIDDDEVILMQVEQILEQNHYRAICAGNGKTGLEKAAAQRPAAIILDRRMPEMDGNETLVELKAAAATRDIPVIMLTGDNAVSDVATSFELGAVDYIVKPFDADNFLIRLRKTLDSVDEE